MSGQSQSSQGQGAQPLYGGYPAARGNSQPWGGNGSGVIGGQMKPAGDMRTMEYQVGRDGSMPSWMQNMQPQNNVTQSMFGSGQQQGPAQAPPPGGYQMAPGWTPQNTMTFDDTARYQQGQGYTATGQAQGANYANTGLLGGTTALRPYDVNSGQKALQAKLAGYGPLNARTPTMMYGDPNLRG